MCLAQGPQRSDTGEARFKHCEYFEHKIILIFLSNILNKCFGCLKEPSQTVPTTYSILCFGSENKIKLVGKLRYMDNLYPLHYFTKDQTTLFNHISAEGKFRHLNY